MRIVVMLFCGLLTTLPVLAGTFRDNFDDGNAEGYILTVGRPPADPEQSLIKVQNGVLLVRRPSGRGLHITIGDADKWSDYTIECDMRIIERIPNEWANLYYAGFAGRFRPDNNGLARDVMWFVINLAASPTIWKGLIIEPDNWLIKFKHHLTRS